MNSSNNDSNRNYPHQRRSSDSQSSQLHRAGSSREGYNRNYNLNRSRSDDKTMNNIRSQRKRDLGNFEKKQDFSYSNNNRKNKDNSFNEDYKIPHYEYDTEDDEFFNQNNGEKKVKKKSKIKTFFKIFFLIFFIIAFGVTGAVIGAIMGIIDKAPNLELIAIEPNIYTSVVYDMNGAEIDRFHGEENREYITLDKIPENMQKAIISIEDERFYSHSGIDFKGIARAVYSTVFGDRREGASTITQQLIKNNITKVMRNNVETKVQEMYLAIKYEDELKKQLGSKRAAKDYILELYLNTIYLNHGYNGIQAASLGYFGKHAEELTLSECAVLAGITNRPSYYSPRTNKENNQKRQRIILKNMLEQGYITNTEYEQAYNDDVYSRISEYDKTVDDTGASVHSYFVDGLFEQISKDLQEQQNMSVAQANNLLYNGGLEIHSTLDQNIQKVVDEAYLNDELFPNMEYKIDVSYIVSIGSKDSGKQEHKEFKQLVKNKNLADDFINKKKTEIRNSLSAKEEIIAEKTNYAVQPQSAMVILDYKNGEIKAISGGRGEKVVNRGLNRAIDSARQPGSVFKVLAAFLPGIDMGVLTPATVIDDVPLDLNGYKPQNWYKNPKYRGLSTIRDGIRDSMNIVAVKAMNQAGIDKSYEYLLKMGFTTLENDNHASTALGGLSKGVTQLETTAAYGMIANGGKYYKPSFYTKVFDHNGKLLLEKQQEPTQIIKEATAYCITDMMKDVITAGTGTAAKFKNTNIPISGKTGTTQNTRDLTFAGYTPYYAAGIWLGYDRYEDNTVKDMEGLKDTTAHLKVWQYVMERIHQGLTVKDFPKPASGIVTTTICSESGKLAITGLCNNDPRGSRVRQENFVEGTQPTENCDVHKSAKFCSSSGMSAGPYCPSTYYQVGIVRPEPYNGSEYIADQKYEIYSGGRCTIHSNYGGDNDNDDDSTESTTNLASESGDNNDNPEKIGGTNNSSEGSHSSSVNNSNNTTNETSSNGNNSNSNDTKNSSSGENNSNSNDIKNSSSNENPNQQQSQPEEDVPIQIAPPPPSGRNEIVIDDPL